MMVVPLTVMGYLQRKSSHIRVSFWCVRTDASAESLSTVWEPVTSSSKACFLKSKTKQNVMGVGSTENGKMQGCFVF